MTDTEDAEAVQHMWDERGRQQCKCQQCLNLDKHPCGHVLSLAIPFAKSQIAAKLREIRGEMSELVNRRRSYGSMDIMEVLDRHIKKA